MMDVSKSVVMIPIWVKILLMPFSIISLMRSMLFGVFSKFECQMFAKLIELLPESSKLIVKSQLEEINFVSRLNTTSTELNLHHLGVFDVELSRKRKFEREDEYILAKLRITTDIGTVSVLMWVVQGNLFSIEFDRKVKGGEKIQSIEVLSMN